MGEPKPEAILKEAIYESGAVPRTTELTVNFFRPNRENMNYVCYVRIVVDEADLNVDVKMESLIRQVSACIFTFAPEIYGISVWLQINPYGSPDGRYSSVSRKDFDQDAPIKLTLHFKKIYSDLVMAQLMPQDKLRLYIEDLSYPELDLLFSIGLCEVQSQLFSKQEDTFKEKVFTIAKNIMQLCPLVRSVGVTFFTQNLTARLAREITSNEFDFHTVKFEPLPETAHRISHPYSGSSW